MQETILEQGRTVSHVAALKSLFSFSLFVTVLSVRCTVEFIWTKKVMCGAWKTPHKGQRQDSAAPKTMDRDEGPGPNAQGSLGHEVGSLPRRKFG